MKKKGLIALSFGTFGLGMTEYVMMSILPDLAKDFGVSVASAGHLISSYAIGVCIGAVLVAILLRNWPLKRILLLLMSVYALGNILFAMSSTFSFGIISRFITGLPHGAFFGAGSIVASRIMPNKETTAVALMTLGMTVANLAGVPLGSFIANNFNWRWIFFFNAGWGILTFLSIIFLVKDIGALKHTKLSDSFQFLKSASPWILIVTTILCQGGCFAMYSYVSPVMEHAGMKLSQIPVLMIFIGAGMCAGNYFSGVLSDKFKPARVTLWVTAAMTLTLIGIWILDINVYIAGSLVVMAATWLFALSSPMQLLLIEYSPGGELMGGAMVQVAFNLGNAVGAFAGGLPIQAGKSPADTALVGAAMALCSVISILWFLRRKSA